MGCLSHCHWLFCPLYHPPHTDSHRMWFSYSEEQNWISICSPALSDPITLCMSTQADDFYWTLNRTRQRENPLSNIQRCSNTLGTIDSLNATPDWLIWFIYIYYDSFLYDLTHLYRIWFIYSYSDSLLSDLIHLYLIWFIYIHTWYGSCGSDLIHLYLIWITYI